VLCLRPGGGELVLRASKNPHSEVVDRLKLRVGQGITGWLPSIKAGGRRARCFPGSTSDRFNELPEISTSIPSVPVLSRDKPVGVKTCNTGSRTTTASEIHLISTIDFW